MVLDLMVIYNRTLLYWRVSRIDSYNKTLRFPGKPTTATRVRVSYS